MGILQAIITAISLCADCFAVSLCSSVTLKSIKWHSVLKLALAFSVIQTSLLLAGWMFGNVFVGLISKISHLAGFLLLLYVGGSMIVEGIRGKDESKDLNGWRNIILGGIATSIDALAVGAAQSMSGLNFRGVLPLLASVSAATALSVIFGILGGGTIGKRIGPAAEIAGGAVLVFIGITLL